MSSDILTIEGKLERKQEKVDWRCQIFREEMICNLDWS